jgi:hypothetical protein
VRWPAGEWTREANWGELWQVYRLEVAHNYKVEGADVFSLREAEVRAVLCDGSELRFDPSLSGYDALAAAVVGRQTAAVRPVLRRLWDAGETLDFGAVVLADDAVRVTPDGAAKPVSPAWDEVTGYRVENGRCRFLTRGTRLYDPWVKLAYVANVPVLFELLDEALAPVAR